MATQPASRVSEEEYLRLERVAEYKSEYVDGEIFAMAGGSPRHGHLAVRWGSQLDSKLGSSGCRVFSSDAPIRIQRTSSYVYPDVSVVCGEAHVSDDAAEILTSPVVVIKILSPSTADYDRGEEVRAVSRNPFAPRLCLNSHRVSLGGAFPTPTGRQLDLP